MVLLSITPLLDGVLRRDIIAPFHTSGPPLLQFHLAIEQWGAGYISGENFFPIPFASFCTITASSEYSYDRDTIIVSAGLTSFKAAAGLLHYIRGWIAIGV